MVLSALLLILVLTPLVMGVAFAFKYRSRLRKPVLSGLLTVAEGYVLAAIIGSLTVGSVLSKIGLSGQPSPRSQALGSLEKSAILAVVLLLSLNSVLLWWNLRFWQKR